MLKVLFLIMVYDNPIIMKEYDILMKHYQKIKEKNHLDNFEFYGYTSGPEDGYDEEKRLFYFNIGIPESLYATYIKTQKMFEYADKMMDFDVVYRANTSTFCNIVLLNEVIKNVGLDNNNILGGELYCKNTLLSDRVDIHYKYVRGNSVIIPRNLLKQIYSFDNNKIEEARKNIILTADDDIIGFIFKDNNIIRKTYFQEWLDCVNMPKHIFGNTNRDPNYLYNFIAIQFKSYTNRKHEINTLNYLCKIFYKYKFKKQYLSNVLQYYNGRNVIWIHPNVGYFGEEDNNEYIQLGVNKEIITHFIKNK